MKIRYLKQSTLDSLRSNIGQNLNAYRSGGFQYFETDPAFTFDHSTDVDLDALAALREPAGGQFFEAENCAILHTALKNLTPYEARDERLWTFLTHTTLLDHGRKRWPIPADDGDAVKHIAQHFFARDKRQIERDNVGSRLWWMGHLCARIADVDQGEALEAFLFRSDVRANLVERPTTSQATGLFGAILRRLVMSYKGKKNLFERVTFRKLMMEVNSVGGYKLLDCLPSKAVEAIVDGLIADKLALSEL